MTFGRHGVLWSYQGQLRDSANPGPFSGLAIAPRPGSPIEFVGREAIMVIDDFDRGTGVESRDPRRADLHEATCPPPLAASRGERPAYPNSPRGTADPRRMADARVRGESGRQTRAARWASEAAPRGDPELYRIPSPPSHPSGLHGGHRSQRPGRLQPRDWAVGENPKRLEWRAAIVVRPCRAKLHRCNFNFRRPNLTKKQLAVAHSAAMFRRTSPSRVKGRTRSSRLLPDTL